MRDFTLEEVQDLIGKECDEIKALLIEKNKAYGNSAISPKRIFSRASSVEQIKCRIDDKLSRLANDHGASDKSEDTVKDLLGYLILLRVAEKLHSEEIKMVLKPDYKNEQNLGSYGRRII